MRLKYSILIGFIFAVFITERCHATNSAPMFNNHPIYIGKDIDEIKSHTGVLRARLDTSNASIMSINDSTSDIVVITTTVVGANSSDIKKMFLFDINSYNNTAFHVPNDGKNIGVFRLKTVMFHGNLTL